VIQIQPLKKVYSSNNTPKSISWDYQQQRPYGARPLAIFAKSGSKITSVRDRHLSKIKQRTDHRTTTESPRYYCVPWRLVIEEFLIKSPFAGSWKQRMVSSKRTLRTQSPWRHMDEDLMVMLGITRYRDHVRYTWHRVYVVSTIYPFPQSFHTRLRCVFPFYIVYLSSYTSPIAWPGYRYNILY